MRTCGQNNLINSLTPPPRRKGPTPDGTRLDTSHDRETTTTLRACRDLLRTPELAVWRDPSAAPGRGVGVAAERSSLWSSLSELRVEQKRESWLHLVLTLGAAVAVLHGVWGASFLVRHWSQFVDIVRQAF